MKRAPITPLLCALAFMIAMFAAGAGTASAQTCCTFTTNVEFVPTDCFNLTLTTSWGGTVTTNVFTANGSFTGLAVPSSSTCPPSPAFEWASMDGGWNKLLVGESRSVKANPNCCVTLKVDRDASGCILITILGVTTEPC